MEKYIKKSISDNKEKEIETVINEDKQEEQTNNKDSKTFETMTTKEFSEYSGKGLTGLANLGNTCFLNSTLQCISHTYELNDLLNKEEYKKKINKKPEALILLEWDKLRKLMWSENCTISPGGFVSSIQKVAQIKDKDIFTGYAQNDLPEFLLFIIDCFHESITREIKMNILGKPQKPKDVLAVKCYKMLNTMYKDDYSEILNLFYGISVTQIYKDDILLRQNPEPFFLINLPIPEEKITCTLYDCFDLYTSKELMDGDNKWYNGDTKEHEEVNKNIMFFSFPDILVMDLKRFNNTTRKTNKLVEFPIDNLDLSKYVIGYNKFSYQYELYGVCNHSGSSLGGHYTAYIKNANNKWYLFNDSRVDEVSNINKVVSSKAYCLFYRKKINK